MHNLKLLVIALIISIWCAYVIKHPDIFVSSILNLQELQEIKDKQRDIAYKTDNQLLDVFLPTTWDHSWSLYISIAYAPTIKLQIEQFTWQTSYSGIKIDSGSLSLEFANISKINAKETLFSIPFSWNSNDILLESGTIVYKNVSRSLAIGKLSITSIHGQ